MFMVAAALLLSMVLLALTVMWQGLTDAWIVFTYLYHCLLWLLTLLSCTTILTSTPSILTVVTVIKILQYIWICCFFADSTQNCPCECF